MRVTLEIQRYSGNETRRVTPGAIFGEVEGVCPGCGTVPFRVQGCGLSGDDDRGYTASAVSACCQENVGYLRAEPETIFGAEEDSAVLRFGRARVYSNTLRDPEKRNTSPGPQR